MRFEWPCAAGIAIALAVGGLTLAAHRLFPVEASTQEQKQKGVRGAAERVTAAREAAEEKDDEKGLQAAIERVRRSRETKPIFTEDERTLVRRWFRVRRSNLPPGLAKRDRLPPGLERQLRERGTLPPGLQRRMQPLPAPLEREMRGLPTGHRRVVLGGHVVIYEDRTGIIHDIVRDVLLD